MKYLNFKIQSVENGNSSYLEKVVAMTEAIVNSNVFEKEFYKELQLTNVKDMDKKSLFNLIMSGKEVANGEVDGEADLNIYFYEREGNVGGMANVETNLIRLNLHNFTSNKFDTNCGTLFHEWVHNIGFKHDSPLEWTSLPYATGNLVSRLVRKYGDKIGTPKRGRKLIIKRPWYFLWLIEVVKWK